MKDYSTMSYPEILDEVIRKINNVNASYSLPISNGKYLVVIFNLDDSTMKEKDLAEGKVIITESFIPYFKKYFPHYNEQVGEYLPLEILRHDPRLVRATLEYVTAVPHLAYREGVVPNVLYTESSEYGIHGEYDDERYQYNEFLIDELTTIDPATLV